MEKTLTLENFTDDVIQIPDILIKEVIEGKPYFYNNYKSVLNNLQNIESIMGCSSLQSTIIELILEILYIKIGRKKYRFLTGEIGHNLDKNNNLSYDIAIFDKNILTPDLINVHYVKVPPKTIIEIDVKIDLGNTTDLEYITAKTQKALQVGIEKIFWILTKTQKVIVAKANESWQIFDWDNSIELIDNQFFNIKALLEKEGVKF